MSETYENYNLKNKITVPREVVVLKTVDTPTVYRSVDDEQKMWKKKHDDLLEKYNELLMQDEDTQDHRKLAFDSIMEYKKLLNEITIAMNTECPAIEKTQAIRKILDNIN